MRYQEAIDKGIYKTKKGWYRIPGGNSYKLSYCDKCKQRCFIRRERKRKNTFCSLECYRASSYKEGKKKCTRCKKWLSLDNFYPKEGSYDSKCKNCYKKLRRTPEYRERYVNYERERRKDVKYRLASSVSNMIRRALKGGKEGKSWTECVDFTREELIAHLKSLFLPGMTLENYGEWHIDHKIPVSYFNFTSPEDEEFKKCFALENLQPLWAEDNIKKGSKLPDDFNE